MKLELRRKFCLRVNFHDVIAAVVQQFDAGERWAEAHAERPPIMRGVQRRGELAHGISEKPHGRDAGEQPAFPQNQTRVEMADDGLLDLRQPAAHGFLTQ